MKKSIFGNLRYNNSSNCPKKLLHIDFDGLSLGTPTQSGAATNWLTNVTGTNVRGYTFPDDAVSLFGTGTSVYIQSIPEGGVTAGTFPDKFTNTIQDRTFPVYGSMAGKELLLQCDVRDTTGLGGQTFANPQTDFAIVVPTAGALANPMDEFYIRMDCWVPADLTTQTGDTGTGQFFLFLDLKTGGYGGANGIGDLRYYVNINGSDGTDKYTAGIDDNANGRGVIPALSVGGIPGTATPLVNYVNIKSTATVRTGCKHTIHMHVKRPTSVSDTTTGIFTVLIEPDGYDPVLVCDIHGDGYTMLGVEELPLTRYFLGLNYTSALLPNPLIIGNTEIWDKPPRILGRIETSNHGPLPWVPTPLSRGTMFGASDGNDANPGTEASPKTYQGAVNAAVNPGDVVFFRGGTLALTTAAHFSLWNVGTATLPIIYEVYPGETFIIDGSAITPGVGSQRRVNFSDSYQKLRGVIIQNMPEYGVYNGGTHNTVDGCEIRDCKLSGISNTGSYNTFINNFIHGCSDAGYPAGSYANGGNADGVSISSGTGNYVGHNRVIGCSDDGIDSWQSLYTRIEYNIVSGHGLGDGNGNGIKAGGNNTGANALVKNNLVYNNVANGIDVNTGINVTFMNNVSYSNGGVGYVLESDTIAIKNVSSANGTVKSGTGVPTQNSWDISGTLTFESTTEGDSDFLKVTQDGTFDGIGAHYI